MPQPRTLRARIVAHMVPSRARSAPVRAPIALPSRVPLPMRTRPLGSMVVIVTRRARQERLVADIEFGPGERGSLGEDVLEGSRPTLPVWPRLVLRDARDQPLAKALPLALLRAAKRHREPEYPTLPRRRENDLTVVAGRGDGTLEVGIDAE